MKITSDIKGDNYFGGEIWGYQIFWVVISPLNMALIATQ